MTRQLVALACLLVVGALSAIDGAASRTFVAYSLKQAQSRLTTGAGTGTDLLEMGGITDPVATIYDARSQDFVLVGLAVRGKPTLPLETFVTVLRAALTNNARPLVSIDPIAAGSSGSAPQPVRFEGAIEDTRLGLQMLEADVVLKKLALGQIRADVWGVPSYLSLSAQQAGQSGALAPVSSLFWIEPGAAELSGNTREGIRVIHRLPVAIRTEVTSADGDRIDEIGTRFSAKVASGFPELALQHPELARVPSILKMVILADGVRAHPAASRLAYWTTTYQIPRVTTPRTYDLLTAREEIPGTHSVVVLSGGIKTDPLLLRLNSGDATALRDVVLQSRPSATALVWNPPLDAWDVAGDAEFIAASTGAAPGGFPVLRRLDVPPPGNPASPVLPPRQPPPPPVAGGVQRTPSLPVLPARSLPGTSSTSTTSLHTFQPPSASPRIGGVMLEATASIVGDPAGIDLSAGNFALVVEGEGAKPGEQTFRKFVTALWAVYYHRQDPGISIDPIADGVPQHLVRYIGNVVYTDLGRVMREADYLMKKWAVGTERPDYRGFQSVDERWVRDGGAFTAASRRFWFVPEDMRFRQAGNMLLFETGRMTLRTQINDPGLSNVVLPSDRAFAAFFTEHYDRIAQKYPIFDELMDYARLVSLAKYLKEKRVPLYWFLMANKDLVIGEDSPGVVDELVKESNSRQGLIIRGGVNLGTQGQYRFDAKALAALRQAQERAGDAVAGARSSVNDATGSSAPISRRDVSFELDKTTYSVVAQHASTSGRDRFGVRYQTDISLHKGDAPAVELVRYFDSNRLDGGDFGNGWRLLIPYRVRPAGSDRRNFLNATIPTQMMLENLLTGGSELLTFSEDRYAAAGYVPEKSSGSQVVGLFITAGGFFRLADRIGNEFWFDGAGNLSDMLLGDDLRVKVAYQRGMTELAAFETPVYALTPAGPETTTFRNAVLPQRIQVTDLVHGNSEALTFSTKGSIAGYVPADGSASRYDILAILSDGSFRLADKQGNESMFDGAGKFQGMIVDAERQLVGSLSVDNRVIAMRYTIDSVGRLIIARAQLSDGASPPTDVVRYAYDMDGNLTSVSKPDDHDTLAAR